jgi:hypothetical protein
MCHAEITAHLPECAVSAAAANGRAQMRHGTVGMASGITTAAAAAAADTSDAGVAPLAVEEAAADSDALAHGAAINALSEMADKETALTGSFDASFCRVSFEIHSVKRYEKK